MSRAKYYRDYNKTYNGKSIRLHLNKRRYCELNDIDYNLDQEWIHDRMLKGCSLTGIKFDLNAVDGRLNPMGPSIDRIDSTMGYLKSNCRVILFCLNAFKSTMSDDEMYSVAKKLIGNFKPYPIQ